jgi:hypothetical protein
MAGGMVEQMALGLIPSSRELCESLVYRPNWGLMEMQKGQKIEGRHAESWDQVCWTLRWRCTTASLLLY